MVYMQNAEEKAKKVGCTYTNPTPYTQILHPILHPKSLVNTGHPAPWCRKCRRFSKTFFEEGRETAVRKQQNIGLLWPKVRMFCLESTDVLPQKYGCFTSKVRMFYLKSTDDFIERISNSIKESPLGNIDIIVRIHIINKVFLHLQDTDAPRLTRISNLA